MSYIGNTNTTQAFTPAIDYFNGDGSTVAFTLSRPVASVAQVQAVISNVPQNPGSAFTVSNNTITFTSAPPSGTSNIYVYYTSPITQVIAPGQGTVSTTSLVDGSVTTAKIADANVTTAKLSSTTGTGAVALASLPSFTTTIGVGGATASASGSGVSFPATQSASTDANTLDDYEEGTWTPTISGTSVTYGLQQGTYTKVGNVVHLQGALTLSGGTIGNVVSGLPFTCANTNNASYGMCVQVYNSNGGITYGAGKTESSSYVGKNSASFSIEYQGSAVASNTAASIANNSIFYFSATYIAA